MLACLSLHWVAGQMQGTSNTSNSATVSGSSHCPKRSSTLNLCEVLKVPVSLFFLSSSITLSASISEDESVSLTTGSFSSVSATSALHTRNPLSTACESRRLNFPFLNARSPYFAISLPRFATSLIKIMFLTTVASSSP
jgi:hypothetical protein